MVGQAVLSIEKDLVDLRTNYLASEQLEIRKFRDQLIELKTPKAILELVSTSSDNPINNQQNKNIINSI